MNGMQKAKKTAPKPKVAKKTAKPAEKALVKNEQAKKLMWAGGAKLLEKVESEEARKQKNSILVMSNVMNVSPFGVNILGGVAYLNKLGRKQKMDQFCKGLCYVQYEWVQMAMDDTQKAICKARVVSKINGNPIADWAVGECSPATIKMKTLGGYQNHIAQTRAHNRAIEEAFGMQIHEETMENLGKLQLEKNQKLPMIDTTTSVEEMGNQKQGHDKEREINIPEAECHGCGNPITNAEAGYAKKLYKRPLCRECQKLEPKN